MCFFKSTTGWFFLIIINADNLFAKVFDPVPDLNCITTANCFDFSGSICVNGECGCRIFDQFVYNATTPQCKPIVCQNDQDCNYNDPFSVAYDVSLDLKCDTESGACHCPSNTELNLEGSMCVKPLWLKILIGCCIIIGLTFLAICAVYLFRRFWPAKKVKKSKSYGRYKSSTITSLSV